jgi:hypothetical protein
LNKIPDFFGKRCPFGSRNPFQSQAALIYAQQAEYLPGFFDYRLTSNITFQVMTIADVSAGYQDAVCAFQKSPEQKAVIHSAGAHYPDQTYIARILYAGHPGQIGSGIRAPVTHEGQDVRLFGRGHVYAYI